MSPGLISKEWCSVWGLVSESGSNRTTKEVSKMVQRIKELFVDEEGAAMVEYALLVGLISIVAISVMTPLGAKILGLFTKAEQAMPAP